MKRHKIKRERPEPSGSYSREQEHDLAYYIHDRVELMHQVFSALKPKDLKAMTPACIRHLSVDNIKELCTEELLGISSKRLCAILDGAEPPTDTESSLSASPERLETISLDSISSDEEILSEASKKSKKKHRHRDRDKSKKKKKSNSTDDEAGEKSKASRAGLTVLELLELQARARAIRAQLQKEQANKQTTEPVESSQDASSDDEVLVKEEPPEVVEISSDDEKPSVAELDKDKQNTSTETEKTEDSQKVTKRVKNLVITVPQKPTRKIKLNRTRANPTSAPDKASTSNEPARTVTVEINTNIETTNNVAATVANKAAEKDAKIKDKVKKKQKKKDKKKAVDKDGSDHDEITLQLSDSEKLDLLEDLDHKNYDKVSSQSSEDSESSSSSSESDEEDGKKRQSGEDISKKDKKTEEVKIIKDQNVAVDQHNSVQEKVQANVQSTNVNKDEDKDVNIGEENTSKVVTSEEVSSKDVDIFEVETAKDVNESNMDKELAKTITVTEEQISSDQSKIATIEKTEKVTEVNKIQDSRVTDVQVTEEISQKADKNDDSTEKVLDTNKTIEIPTDSEISKIPNADKVEISTVEDPTPETSKECTNESTLQGKNDGDKQMSEGELSERDSSDVEASEVQPEVVCISDDEGKSKKSKKKHKKKEKKNKKEKKSKKDKPDFRSGSDQNFYKESTVINTEDSKRVDEPIVIDEDDIYEILELSDDSSCYEVEGTVLSKEPTAEEIEALSAKIDEIERIEVVTEEEIAEHERSLADNNETDEKSDDLEQISWKDRYLGSTKVKKVLTTSNILNALRKKNKELKKKLEESKPKEIEVDEPEKVKTPEKPIESDLEEGSIEHYNALQGSTKYVDPVKETEVDAEEKQKNDEDGKEKEGVVTKEMKKDAKQLLKMYKRLLKYNDMNKQKDPKKKKKKKQKKKSKDSENVASVVNNGT